jgi:predicted aldo/keto reductase-like oxidoreductase
MSHHRNLTRRDLLKMGVVGAGAGAFALAAQSLGIRPALAGDPADASLPQVPRRVLGRTGESIPILLMGGGMKLDPRFDPKLAEALRFGINYIDAADCYSGGTCETAVASFLKRGAERKQYWITSKSDKHDPAGFEATLHQSLEKLETDYVDMFFLHALKNEDFLSDELKTTVERLKKEGKIRHFGFSCHDGTVVELLNRAAATPWVESVMFRYNFREYGNTKLNQAIDACAKANVGLIAMKTQGSEASFQDAWKKFEQTGKWTKHQAVLKAVWADDRITAAVSHMDNMEKLKQNIGAAVDKTDLGAAEFEALRRYAADTRAHACDGCDHLCGAAVEAPVEIGATMRYLMYHDLYGEPEKARELFRALPAAARDLARVDFGPANAACPHGVDVAAHMRRAAEVLTA